MNFRLSMAKNDINENILISLIIFFPISLFAGSAIINATTIILSILFLFEIIRTKQFSIFKSYFLLMLLFFFISLFINLIFSQNIAQSFPRAFGFMRFIPFVFVLTYLIKKNYKNEKKIFISWTVIFIIVSLDLIFEKFFGNNILGYNARFGRLAGFMGNELKIGHYYFIFTLLSIITIQKYYTKNIYFILLCCFIFLLISFLIGERANFIKNFMVCIIFLLIIYRKYLIKLFFTFITLLVLIITFLQFNRPYQARYWDHILKPIINHGIISYYKQTQYAAHVDTAINIFKNNMLFGVGLKNFRNESKKEIYENNEYKLTNWRVSTHPHQYHAEFLSETGFIGYACWLLFMFASIFISLKNYFKNKKNLYLISSTIILTSHLIPIIPTGSFFSTYGASLFWLNYSILICYCSVKNNY